MNKATEIIKYILPYLVTAGNYAKEIQKRIVDNNSKSENNIFSEALTDADLSVQNFIEICLLGKFPELNFYGEEYASSLNQKYFSQKSDLTVLLDPIDGTRIYKDGHRGFSIILSIIDKEDFLASITYFPADQKAYLAIKDQGAFVLTNNEMLISEWENKINLTYKTDLIRTFNQNKISLKLKELFPVFDVLTDYKAESPGVGIDEIFNGELGAFFYTNAQFIDGAAFAFILKEAGGIVTDIDGNNLPKIPQTTDYLFPTLIASVDKTLHDKILFTLNKNKELFFY